MTPIARSLFLSWTVLVSTAAVAAPLSKDGGDPGKAYRVCLDALAKADKAAIVSSCFAKDDPWIAKTNVDYFGPAEFAVEVRQLRPDYRLIDVAISGGEMNGDEATLRVSGKLLLQRVEPTGDIVDVSRDPVKGTVTLRRSASGWRPAGGEVARVH